MGRAGARVERQLRATMRQDTSLDGAPTLSIASPPFAIPIAMSPPAPSGPPGPVPGPGAGPSPLTIVSQLLETVSAAST